MHFSKASTYGIRSVAYIAAQKEKDVVSIRELSEQLDIPAAFLTKVMQRLASGYIVKTMRGHGGGVSLNKPSSEITLKEIITAIDGEEAFDRFWLGLSEKHMELVPEFRAKWQNLNNNISDFFSNTRLTELYPSEEKSEHKPIDLPASFF